MRTLVPMDVKVVTLLGAGSLRCSPVVLASLASYRTDGAFELRLFDANEERLDLFDRFARACLDSTHAPHALIATSDAAEALKDADHVIFALGEDCARRQLLLKYPPGEEEQAPEPEPRNFLELVRGDPNRPTPLDQLSPQMRRMLDSPARLGRTREEALAEVVEELLALTPPMARLLNLMRGALLPAERRHSHLMWPNPLDDEALERLPHQVLRWVRRDQSVDDFVQANARSPLTQWLDATE